MLHTAVSMLMIRGISDSAPPEPRTRLQNNPTLLFSWWCTGFCLVIILLRLSGRYVRTERLFREDKVMALAIIPLLVRMGLIHVVLIYGTNNINVADRDVSDLEVLHRALGSRLVLGARIFYAMFIWIAKFTVSEFLKRLTERYWKRRYDLWLRAIRIFLVVTFFVVVIATLTECRPFDHYWQVVPDPGPRCRQGYAHLIAMGVTDMITDVLIVVFPIPIIWKSSMGLKRKLNLTALFSLSTILIVITAARIPNVIHYHGRQQFRTVFASGEMLAAAAVSNAVVLGSFLRDRGVKKQKKYKYGSTVDSMEQAASVRRPTITTHQWGSDEDLFHDVGIRLDPELHAQNSVPRPAPVAAPAGAVKDGFLDPNWQFPSRTTPNLRDSEESDLKIYQVEPNPPSPHDISHRTTGRNMSFFDVGGLLESGSIRSSTVVPSPTSTTSAQDWALPRRGSRALLSDLGGLLSPAQQPRRTLSPHPENDSFEMTSRSPSRPPRSGQAPMGVVGPRLTRAETRNSLQDVGGLLTEHTGRRGRRPSTATTAVNSETATMTEQSQSAGPSPNTANPTRWSPLSEHPIQFADPGGLLNDTKS